ncbi:MAG TPA: hypothetical protein VIM73_22185 [Polyangiaceae bacterium]
MRLSSRHAPLALLVALAWSASYVACSSDSKDRPPAVETGGNGARGGEQSGGGSGNTLGGKAGSAGRTTAEAGESTSGEGGAAGAPVFESDAGPGRPDLGPPQCHQTASWSSSTPLTGVSLDANQPLSLTHDELDLAFIHGGVLYTAHRVQASDPFTVSAPVALPSGWDPKHGFALSDDGKRLVLVSVDQTAVGELTRSARDAAFISTVDQTAFELVNQASMYSGNVFAAPLLSADDAQLFLSSTAPGGSSTVVVATRTRPTDAWGTLTRIGAELDGPSGARRLPTGISADARTLFYFNEESMKEEARFRAAPIANAPLYDMVDLGKRRGATPNTACTRLYSTSASSLVFESN